MQNKIRLKTSIIFLVIMFFSLGIYLAYKGVDAGSIIAYLGKIIFIFSLPMLILLGLLVVIRYFNDRIKK